MRVFLTGATGLIGGTVAAKLIQAGHCVRGLVRDETRATLLAGRGIVPVVGTLDHLDTLAREAQAADATINAANADNPFAAMALMDALKGSGKRLLHTSGSTVVGDHAAGAYAGTVHHEDLPAARPLPEKVSRIATDRMVQAAAGEGVHSVVLCPSLVYGTGLGVRATGPQLMRFIELARERGHACHIGNGANVWSHVHVEDLADAYLLALEKAPAGSFFYLAGGESSWREMAEAIGRLLGLNQPPAGIDHIEAVRRWGAPFAHAMGGNSRVSSTKARAMLGWSPSRPSILHDVEHGSYRQALG